MGREGKTIEDKKRLRFLEDDESVGTANEVGCTACTVIITDKKILTVNAGDSRAVLAQREKNSSLELEKQMNLPS